MNQGLVKQNSGGVFMVGEGQATMENDGTQSDLQPSAVRTETTTKHA